MPKPSAAHADEARVSLLVFRAGSPQPKAVPLSLVTRLEEIDCKKIELSNGRHMVQYRGQLMPLVRVNDEVRDQARGRAAAAGVLRRRPLDGARGRRDRRHRRGQARHPGRQRPRRRARLGRRSRARRPRSSTSAISCRSPSRTGSAARTCSAERADAHAAAGRRLAVLPQHAGAGAQGRRLRRDRGRRAAQEALALLKKGQRFDVDRHRHRDAGHGRLRARRGGARRSAHRRHPDHRAVVAQLAGSDRARPPGRLPRLRRQVRPPGPDRGAQGADRRHRSRRREDDHGNDNDSAAEHVTEYVTVTIGGQLFGLPISRVQDVFMPDRLTRVPLAPPEIAGVLNLRGRIVTAIDMRARLGLAARADGKPVMAVGIELKGESYGLLVDAVGEVMKLAETAPARPIRSISIARLARVAGRRLSARRPAAWSCSTSIACSTSANGADGGMRTAAWECKRAAASEGVRRHENLFGRRRLQRHPQGGAANSGRAGIQDHRGRGRRAGARAHASAQMPDAVLLDWNMPKMDGYEFLKALRRLPGGDRPKVVFCTTENDVAHIARALHAGANEYIMKPFDKEIVEAKFQEVGLI